MSRQRHVVKKQLIELRVSTAEAAQQLQANVGQIYRQQIIPLLEHACSALSNSDQIIRIDRLEIDLGAISRDNFEQQWVAAVKRQLPEQLERVCRQAGGEESGAPGSALELLDFFLRLGYLPWWADSGSPELLENALRESLRQPQALRRQLNQWHGACLPLRRLVNTFADIHLLSLLKAVVPKTESVWLDRLQLLGNTLPLLVKTPANSASEIRQLFWVEVFAWLKTRQFNPAAGSALMSALLPRMGRKLNLTASELLAALASSESDFSWIQPSAVVTSFQTRLSPAPDQRKIVNAEFDRELLQSLQRGVLQQDHFDLLMSLIASGQLAPEIARHLRAVATNASFPEGAATSERLSRLYRALDTYIATEPYGESDEPETSVSHPAAKHTEDEQTVYIENAGLVIFWPFLPRFFARLDLLDEKVFRTPQAQYRAVQLLEYLVTGEPRCVEYRLPLNKLLCDLELREVVTAERPLSREEMHSGDQLIQAVIDQAPILANTSADGLRHSFLQRGGVISQRDGAWLLRVEQQTLDIVLDRLPWGFDWVKLPWMRWAMRVEWI